MENLTIIVPLGKPCSGKDALAKSLQEKYSNSRIISTGQILRDAQEQGELSTHYNDLKKDFNEVNQAGYIKDENIIKVVTKEIHSSLQEGKRTLIFSGFPRTVKQLDFFWDMLKEFENNFYIMDYYFYLDVSDETARERSKKRIKSNIKNNIKPRPEDIGEKFNIRLDKFKELTIPLCLKIKENNWLTFISTENLSANEVFSNVQKYLEGYYPGKERR